MWETMDIFEKIKAFVILIGFTVALMVTVICPFSQVITLGLVGKLWLAYLGLQLGYNVLDGTIPRFVSTVMSLRER